MKIGIIGAGHAGIALAALLLNASAAHNIRIYAAPGHTRKLNAIMRGGGHLQLMDRPNGKTALLRLADAHIAPSIRELVQFSHIIFNTTPVTAHDRIFEEVLLHETGGKRGLTYVNLGGGFSYFAHRLAQRAMLSAINVGTLHTLPYAGRVIGSTVTILNYREVTEITFGAVPNAEQLSLLASVLRGTLKVDADPLHMSLDRSSYVMHPVITLFNISRIDQGESFRFYADGFSRPIQDLHLQAHRERQRLAKSLGYTDYPSPEERLLHFLEAYGKDFSTISAPTSAQHRYLTEDIPYGLVPIVDLGQLFGIDMPVCRSIIDIGSAITKTDLWASPYRLANNAPLRGEFLQGIGLASGGNA